MLTRCQMAAELCFLYIFKAFALENKGMEVGEGGEGWSRSSHPLPSWLWENTSLGTYTVYFLLFHPVWNQKGHISREQTTTWKGEWLRGQGTQIWYVSIWLQRSWRRIPQRVCFLSRAWLLFPATRKCRRHLSLAALRRLPCFLLPGSKPGLRARKSQILQTSRIFLRCLSDRLEAGKADFGK